MRLQRAGILFSGLILFVLLFSLKTMHAASHPGVDSIGVTSIDTTFTLYLIKPGETISFIAEANKVSMNLLIRCNQLNPRKPIVYAGQNIKIPKLTARKVWVVAEKKETVKVDPAAPVHENLKPESKSIGIDTLAKENSSLADTPISDSSEPMAITESVKENTIKKQDEEAPVPNTNVKTTDSLHQAMHALTDKRQNPVIDTAQPGTIKKKGKETKIETTNATVTVSGEEPVQGNKTASEVKSYNITEEKKKVMGKSGKSRSDQPFIDSTFLLPAIEVNTESVTKEDKHSKKTADSNTVTTKEKSETKSTKKSKNSVQSNTAVVDTNFMKADIRLKEVQVAEKKLKKLKMTDSVDAVHAEKAQFYLARAMKDLDEKAYSKAESHIAKALSLNPKYMEAYMVHADMNISFGMWDKAIKDFSNALKADPNVPNAYYNRASCYVKMNEFEKAIKDFNSAISLDSNYILALGGRASMLMNKKEFYSAIEDYTKIISLNKYFAPAYKARGVARMEIGDYNGSIDDLSRYLESTPKDAYALFQRGTAKLKAGKLYECCLDYLAASELGYPDAKAAIKKHCN